MRDNSTDRKSWAYISGSWADFSDQHIWTHAVRPSVAGSNAKKYFDTLEHNINQGVYYCATALNWIINHAGYSDCNCGSEGSANNPNPPPEGEKKGMAESLQLSLEQFESLFYFSFTGLLATALALALLNKVELLEALISI